MLSRRAFARSLTAFAAVAATRRAFADDIVDGDEAHPVEAPDALELQTWTWDKTPFYGAGTTVIVATPKGLAPGAQLPLVVLLPGGHHTMQRHPVGCWGWWSEYRLGDIDAALRRGRVEPRDFHDLGRAADVEWFNGLLSSTPYRGAVLVTPWVVGRQLDPAPHGAMVTEFLRMLVERARAELPVATTREATGLGGMSSGGLWALYAGAGCSDLFGTVVATQPFTEELLVPLRAAIGARKVPQRLRMVTSEFDHQRKPTVELSEALRADGLEHELVEYAGAHSAQFAAGPGGLDALLVFDRALRGEQLDGTRPLPPHDGLALPIAVGDLPPRVPASLQPSQQVAAVSPRWPAAAIGVATAAAALAVRRDRG